MVMVKNKLRDFGVFMALVTMPIFLLSLGVCSAIQAVLNFTAGLISIFPANLMDGGGFVFSMIGCVVLIAMGAFFFWAALPVYREHLNG